MALLTNDIIYNNYDQYTGEPFNARVTTVWHDGSGMDDTKVDNVIYFKNAATLGGGYSKRCYSGAIRVSWFGIMGDGTDETEKLILLLKTIWSGCTVDFEDKDILVYSTITAVSTGDAAPLDAIIRLANKANITLKNGIVRAANPGVSPTLLRFPSTFSIDRCVNITFENFVFFAKGQSYGDSDASASLTHEQRRFFIQQNGGAACTIVKSKYISFNNCKGYLAGSVGTFYVSSSHLVSFNNCYSNPASLGYAAFCHDAWAGSNYDNVNQFESTYINCSAYLTPVSGGSSTYCGKGGVLVEDSGVKGHVIGGVWKDMYANGAARYIGFAFGCGSAELYVNAAIVDKCDCVGYLNTSSSSPGLLTLSDIVATDIRRCFLDLGTNATSSVIAKAQNCSVNVIGGATWPNGPMEEQVTSYIACKRSVTSTQVELSNCNLTGATYGFINTKATYGGLRIINSYLEVTNQIGRTAGWGSSSATIKSRPNDGLLLSGRAYVNNIEALTALIVWNNPSPENVYTRVSINTENLEVYSSSATNRQLLALTTSQPILTDDILLPSRIAKGAYVRNSSPAAFKFDYGLYFKQRIGLQANYVVASFSVRYNVIPTRLIGLLHVDKNTAIGVAGYKEIIIDQNDTIVVLYLESETTPLNVNGFYKFEEF